MTVLPLGIIAVLESMTFLWDACLNLFLLSAFFLNLVKYIRTNYTRMTHDNFISCKSSVLVFMCKVFLDYLLCIFVYLSRFANRDMPYIFIKIPLTDLNNTINFKSNFKARSRIHLLCLLTIPSV